MLRNSAAVLLGFAIVLVSGCGKAPDEVKPAAETAGAPDGEHCHQPGQHGGSIVEIGRDNYHAEAVFGEEGLVLLYMLARDEAQIQEVESQTLTAYARAAGDTRGVEFTLKPQPRKDD